MCRGRIQRVFAGGFAVFWFYSSRRVPRQRQDFEGRAKGELLCRAVAFFPREVIENFPDAKRFCFADKAPLSFRFEILHLGCRDFRPDERREPWTYLGCLSQITEPEPELYPCPPRIRLKILRDFRTFYRSPVLTHKSRFSHQIIYKLLRRPSGQSAVGQLPLIGL